MAPSIRRMVANDEDSDQEQGVSITEADMVTSAEKAQRDIMMKDLGTETRDQITSSVQGRRGPYISQRMIYHMRECNQEGTEAAAQVAQNLEGLTSWSNFHLTTDAQAGNENLHDIAAGNSHRINIRERLAEEAARNGGVLTLEDIDDRRENQKGVPPPFRNRAGNAAAYNDRGAFGRGRGGGFTGRGGARGGAFATSIPAQRPLDPAVDTDRDYFYKGSGRKNRGPRVQMVDNRVTMRPADRPEGANKRKRLGQVSTPRMNRGPLPDFIGNAIKLADPSEFMEAVAKKFLLQNESKIATSSTVTPSQQAAVQQAEPEPPKSTLTQDIHKIQRSESVPKSRRPSGFTDGNITSASFSGFSSSNDGDGSSTTMINEPAIGLGIQGTALTDVAKNTASTLMDVDVPAVKNAVLTPSLQASPQESNVSIPKSEYEQFEAFKAVISGARSSQDLVQWLEAQKKKTAPPINTVDSAVNKKSAMEANSTKDTVVNIAAGYTIGSSQLERIIGDHKSFKPAVKSTQTTPTLLQSKWASPALATLKRVVKGSSSVSGETKPSTSRVEPEQKQGPAYIKESIEPATSLSAIPEGKQGPNVFTASVKPSSSATDPKLEKTSTTIHKPGEVARSVAELDPAVATAPAAPAFERSKRLSSSAVVLKQEVSAPVYSAAKVPSVGNVKSRAKIVSSGTAQSAKVDNGARLQAQMQSITKNLAKTQISGNGTTSVSDKDSVVSKSSISISNKESTGINDVSTRHIKKPVSRIRKVAAVTTAADNLPAETKRFNPFAPREVNETSEERLVGKSEPFKFDFKVKKPDDPKPNPFNEPKDTESVSQIKPEPVDPTEPPNPKVNGTISLPAAQVIKTATPTSAPAFDKIAHQPSVPQDKPAAPKSTKKTVTDSKWASTTGRFSKGASKGAAASTVDDVAPEVALLRARPGNQISAFTESFYDDSKDLRGSDKQQPVMSENSPTVSIFGDTKNLKHSSSSFNTAQKPVARKSAASKPKKMVPPGLKVLLKEQEEQREFDPDEIKEVVSDNYGSAEGRQALSLASDILRKYRNLDR